MGSTSMGRNVGLSDTLVGDIPSRGAAGEDEAVSDAFVLPSAGPDPIPIVTALAAVLGYARGRRPLHFRSPSAPAGRWVQVPAFGYERFDVRARVDGPLGEHDILPAEGLHGRLDPAAWAATTQRLADVRPLFEAVITRAGGRRFEQLPDDEFSVLAEPGTVGALLRQLGTDKHLTAALHHRRPDLVPLSVRATRWQLLPHVREGDSGVEAVIHRELTANAEAFASLRHGLADHGIELTALRLHDVLLWLSGTLRLTHAVTLGRAAVPLR
jgi:hypothetical protein